MFAIFGLVFFTELGQSMLVPLSSVLSDAASRSLPFWPMAAGTAAVTLGVASARGGDPERAASPGLRAVAQAAGRDPVLRRRHGASPGLWMRLHPDVRASRAWTAAT